LLKFVFTFWKSPLFHSAWRVLFKKIYSGRFEKGQREVMLYVCVRERERERQTVDKNELRTKE
jgi:hypothetical protein